MLEMNTSNMVRYAPAIHGYSHSPLTVRDNTQNIIIKQEIQKRYICTPFMKKLDNPALFIDWLALLLSVKYDRSSGGRIYAVSQFLPDCNNRYMGTTLKIPYIYYIIHKIQKHTQTTKKRGARKLELLVKY